MRFEIILIVFFFVLLEQNVGPAVQRDVERLGRHGRISIAEKISTWQFSAVLGKTECDGENNRKKVFPAIKNQLQANIAQR